MLTPKVLGVFLVMAGLFGYLMSIYFNSKLIFFYSCMSGLFGIAACIRILANPDTLKKKVFLVVGVKDGVGVQTVTRLCSVGATVLIIREDAAIDTLERLNKQFPENVFLISHDDQSNDFSSAFRQVEDILQNKTLKGVVFASDEFAYGDLELLPSANISQLLQQNVHRVVTIVKTFLPLLRESRGRVIFLGHVFGRLPMPSASMYSLTKSAIEGFADGLRYEMRRFDVKVIIVERCGHSPNVQDKLLSSKMWSEATPDAQHTYGRDYMSTVVNKVTPGTNGPIVSTLIESMAADNPKDRYIVCSAQRKWCSSKIETIVSQFLPATIMDIWVDKFHSLPSVLNLPEPSKK